MRILLYAPNYLPATRYGGPIRSSHGLAKALVGLGHDVQVFTTNVDGVGVLDVPLERDVEIDGLRVRYFAVQPPRRIYFSPAMGRAMAAEVGSFDVAHVNGVYLWPGPKLAREATKARVPLVISPRGMLSPEMIAGKSQFVKRAWIQLIERSALASAAAIHATSQEEADGLRRLALDLAPLHVIANGVDLPAERPTQADIERLWAGVPRGDRVAMLARLDWTKGVDLAIDAVLAHPSAQILIAGPDQIGLRAQLEPRLRSAGRPAGRFVGELDGVDKWALLCGADVLLAPSVKESFGMAVAEALAAGTPVICTEGVGAASIVRRIDPGLVTTRTVEALASSLGKLLECPLRRARTGREARDIMTAEFTWTGIARQMLDLYVRVVGQKECAA